VRQQYPTLQNILEDQQVFPAGLQEVFRYLALGKANQDIKQMKDELSRKRAYLVILENERREVGGDVKNLNVELEHAKREYNKCVGKSGMS